MQNFVDSIVNLRLLEGEFHAMNLNIAKIFHPSHVGG
jgi:hypothetical protein